LNRVVRFQATYVGVRAGRRPAEHTGHAHCYADAANSQQLQTSSADAGLWARTPGRFQCVAGKRPQRFLASTSVLAFSLCKLAGRFLPCDGCRPS
jgi:hypothetical protein